MKICIPFALAACLASRLFAQTSTPDDLAAVRTLYASAEYEKALDRLSHLDEGKPSESLIVYRALCLLALGRTTDLEQTLEQLVIASPGYTLDEREVSPRLIEMFDSVRRRELPNIARSLYAQAKANFAERRFAEADAQLTSLIGLVDQADDSDPTLTDLKMLGTGFRELARAQLSAAPTSAAGKPGATAPSAVGTSGVAAPAAAGAGPAAPAIFSAADSGVVAPVELSRAMPPWHPTGELARHSFLGVLEILIDEEGRVENAIVRESLTPPYDAALLAATRNWRYQPATRDGVPVKYRSFVRVVLGSLGR